MPTKQTFELVAAVIRENRPATTPTSFYQKGREAAGREIAEKLADQLGQSNPRFNRDLFLQAADPRA